LLDFLELLGFLPECGNQPAEGYAFPYHDYRTGVILTGDDGLPFWRVRLRYPAIKPAGAKYLSRKGSGVRAFITRETAQKLANPEAPVYIVEGEKKALAMTKVGFPAIGIAGVTCWRIPKTSEILPQIAEFLAPGREVVFVQDSDMRFNIHAPKNRKALATACARYGAELKSVVLPPNGDCKVGADDYLAAHGVEAFGAIMQTAEFVKPDGRCRQEAGNHKISVAEAAATIAKTFFGETPGDAPRLAYWRGKWYFRADCGGYRPVQPETVESEVTAELLKTAPELASRRMVGDILNLFRSNAYFFLPEEAAPPFFYADGSPLPAGYIAVKNGYLRADSPESGIAASHTQVFGLNVLPVDFDPDADCPKFKAYLETLLPDPEARKHVQLMLGLSLVPDTSFNVMFFLYDPQGGSGRSVLLKVIRRLVGDANVAILPLSNLNGDFVGEELTSALVNIIDDLPERFTRQYAIAVDTLKSLTSGAPVRINKKHRQEIENRLATARIIAATNYLPAFTESDDALYDRIRIIPFHVRIRGTGLQNPRLDDELAAEQSGIFNFAVEGLRELRALTTFPVLPEGEALIAQHREETDSVRTFCKTRLAAGGPEDFIPSRELWLRYQDFCNREYEASPLSQKVFFRRLSKNLPTAIYCTRDNVRGYRGIIHI